MIIIIRIIIIIAIVIIIIVIIIIIIIIIITIRIVSLLTKTLNNYVSKFTFSEQLCLIFNSLSHT